MAPARPVQGGTRGCVEVHISVYENKSGQQLIAFLFAYYFMYFKTDAGQAFPNNNNFNLGKD